MIFPNQYVPYWWNGLPVDEQIRQYRFMMLGYYEDPQKLLLEHNPIPITPVMIGREKLRLQDLLDKAIELKREADHEYHYITWDIATLHNHPEAHFYFQKHF